MTETCSMYNLSLDRNLYSLDGEEQNFFKRQTDIQDGEKLKEHIIAVQEEAFKVVNYPCIQGFRFTKLKIGRHPAYKDFLKLGQERRGAIYLEMACCFGNDARLAVMDGFPVENVIAADIRPEFWELGHKLFKSTHETFPVPFIAGDVFDPAHIAPCPPFYSSPSGPTPDLATVTSLIPLQGRISAIHASAFFHLFNEAQQLIVAQRLASLLSPEPGSMIFGQHGGVKDKGPFTSFDGVTTFNHSIESWREMWDGGVFKKGEVTVEAVLQEVAKRGKTSEGKDRHWVFVGDGPFYVMDWCVKRI
ncbi:hypothetical protein BD410DRAFT_782211 [Rickenella mellea]|uniref:Methyltransferase domain-containing protein n=1 Tax=Rickenella mellea TaxID=50990 RepID=A0A4Y7QMZ9_9AGAM|nr:hypothetical protein BD410DRAFT_782211 [Rickenella mellea]